MRRHTRTFAPGDKVAYSAGWLRGSGTHTGDIPFLRGEIVRCEPLGEEQLCTIAWSLNGQPYRVHSQYHTDGFGRVIGANLVLCARIAEDAALADVRGPT